MISVPINMQQIDKDFWDDRWKNKETGWDLKSVSPPLKEYIDTIEDKNAAILIPGCGNAYEAEYLLANGFTNITVIDLAPTLIQNLLQKYEKYAGRQLTVICGDFFKHTGTYDIILEQTFFCALLPTQRQSYVVKMHSLLRTGGNLAGLLFDKQFESGPPFGGSKEEYIPLFQEQFEIMEMESCASSIAPRAGTELFFIVNKR